MITGTPNWVATDQRIEGYRMALAAVGVPFTADLLAGGDFATGTGYTAAQHLLDLPDPPTAIFASNDNLAIGAMRAAFERGLHVPDELSIVGFDDVGSASDVFPPSDDRATAARRARAHRRGDAQPAHRRAARRKHAARARDAA